MNGGLVRRCSERKNGGFPAAGRRHKLFLDLDSESDYVAPANFVEPFAGD